MLNAALSRSGMLGNGVLPAILTLAQQPQNDRLI